MHWLEVDFEEAQERSRRTRNAPIATSASFGLGVIGMLTSRIMLGVSNNRKRETERDIRRIQYGHRLQWDIPKGMPVSEHGSLLDALAPGMVGLS